MAKRINVEAQIEAILAVARGKVQELADEYRTCILIPLCRRHRLTYMAGNGTTAFYDRNDVSVDETDKPYLRGIMAELNECVLGTNDVFGFYINDVKLTDLS